jgi:hypothetical protein
MLSLPGAVLPDHDSLVRSAKQTTDSLVQGIGFDYEQQYQEALEKAYPVSSGADRVQRGGHDEGGLLDRFKKAAEDPSLQPGHDVLSVRDRIKARIKHALTEKERAAKSDGMQLMCHSSCLSAGQADSH